MAGTGRYEGYVYPVFLSYRQNSAFDRFFTRFHYHLEAQLRQHVAQFFDPCEVFRDVEPGATRDLPTRVGQALCRSAVLVSLVSPSYYGPASPFTSAELDHMLDRMTSCERDLVFPVVMTEGDLTNMPERARRLLREDVTTWADEALREGSRHDTTLRKYVSGLAKLIAELISTAPPHDPTWCAGVGAAIERAWQIRDATPEPLQTELLTIASS